MQEKLVSKFLLPPVCSRIERLGGKYKIERIVHWTFENREKFEEAKEILRDRGELL